MTERLLSDAWWIIDQLVQQGVTKFCIAPGSRSTPLVLAAAEHPMAETVVHFDERGVGFYALGIGKGARQPAAVIATSGTGCANLFPAIMEAHHSATPLVVLTADRPCELRSCGANQTTDQVKLFSNFIRWQMDLIPNLDEKTVRSIAAQSVFHTIGNHPGPVHLNCQFREPLWSTHTSPSQGAPISFSLPKLIAQPVTTRASRGVILLGPGSNPAPVLALAKRLQWPVFADLLSNARCHPSDEQIRHFDFLIRSPRAPKPDFLLHFGERFISKHLLDWAPSTPYLHVSPRPALQDPARRVTSRVLSDVEPFCATFDAATDPHWLSEWQSLDRDLGAAIDAHFQSPFCEAHAFRTLPGDRPLFLGNSMPIRNADHFFFPSKCRGIFANRGVSGIDGNIATAAGIADALAEPLVALIGDQAALHDLNSLPLLKTGRLLLIISNNFGGGIFDHLPISQSPHLETYFTASHSWRFEDAARMFDLPYVRWEKQFDTLPPSGIVELITDRKENHQFQKGLLETCSHAFA